MNTKQEKLNEIIRSFRTCGMMREFLGTDSFELAVACRYRDANGRILCCSHQRHIRHSALEQILEKLKAQKENISKAGNFEELHKIVDDTQVRYIGDLTKYDIAVRLGFLQNPKILPQELVYIHAGTYEGAKALYDSGVLKSKPKGIMHLKDFEVLEGLNDLNKKECDIPDFATYSMLIENFLCVKKDELKIL